jgi:hypothetical protein
VSDDRSVQPVQVLIAAAKNLASAIDAAVESWLSTSPLAVADEVVLAVPTVALARDPFGAPLRLAERLKRAHRSVRIVAPPRTLAGSLLSARQADRWATVAVSPNAEWLDRASIVSTLATPSPIVFVNAFEARRSPSSPVIGAWVRFAHPSQRLAAAATDQREGLTVEIASAFHPALILLVAADHEPPLAIASDDQIAAELVALAIHDLRQQLNDDEEMIGPWERPLIQRATELGLGITWPGALQVQAIWTSRGDEPSRSKFFALIEQIGERLGVPHPINITSDEP